MEQFLDPSKAAAFLAEEGRKVSKATLAKWRCLGGGPARQKFGRFDRYRTDSIREFAAARVSAKVRSTSDKTDR